MYKNLLFLAVASMLLVACVESQSDMGAQTPRKKVAKAAELEQTNKLNIFNWSDYVHPKIISEFEKKNKILVDYDLYDSNEMLEDKIITGKSGYDVVVPSLAQISHQVESGAYQKIDKSLIPNYKNIDPQLLKLMAQVDADNEYAVPYFWGITTIGINVDQVKKALGGKMPNNEWDLLFNPDYTSKLKSCGISILDSPTDVFPMVLMYLGKPTNSSNPEDLKAAADLLKKVKKDYRHFSSNYIDDLAHGDVCVALGFNGDLNIAANRAEQTRNPKSAQNIAVLIPKKGFGIWVDAWTIPVDAQNVLNAHKYIDYTLDPKVAAANADFVTYAPAVKEARALMNPKYAKSETIFLTEDILKNGFVMKPMTQEGVKLSSQLWREVKSTAKPNKKTGTKTEP